MLTRSAGHAHSWRAGVGMRALCPFLGAGAGHVRWAWVGERPGQEPDMFSRFRGTCSFLAAGSGH